MSYRVIHYFTDLQDLDYPYKVGDLFPRQGLSVSEERLKELSSDANKRGMPLIELVSETKQSVMQESEKNKSVNYTKTEIYHMSTSQLRELALNNGVDDAKSMTGAEIKKLLIEKFEL